VRVALVKRKASTAKRFRLPVVPVRSTGTRLMLPLIRRSSQSTTTLVCSPQRTTSNLGRGKYCTFPLLFALKCVVVIGYLLTQHNGMLAVTIIQGNRG
jgi:hypothetical protein